MRLRIYTMALLFATLQAFAQTYTYDSNCRLTKVVYENGVTVNYTYDALGNRLTKKVTGGTTVTTFTITTNVTPSGSGMVTGGGTFAEGSDIELHAIANAGYEFSKWSDGETDNPRTVTVTKDKSYTAQFKESTVTPDLLGDIVVDGKVDWQDLNALAYACVTNAQATKYTDINGDGTLSIVDITKLISIINENSNSQVNSNGHQYVDLGLPSGTLWATCNVGALAPEELGNLYAWGETESKETYSWNNYKWCDGTQPKNTNPSLTKYCDRGAYGTLDGKITLELADDVAHVKWGGDWHMPTKAEMQELIDNCTAEWIKLSDQLHAYKFTGSNGNSIVMPAAGVKNNSNYNDDAFYYWSSELHMNDNPANNHGTSVDAMEYSSKTSTEIIGNSRYKGLAVRPVLSKFTPIIHDIYGAPSSYMNHNLVDLGLPSGTLWAACNIGASSPEDYGCYYAWGETTGSCDGKTSYIEDTYKYYNGSSMTKYHEDGEVLEPSDDAATAQWKGQWRMPTYQEIVELEDTKYTVCEWTTENGVNGYRITSIVKGFEGNSIFLPAAGCYRDKTGRLFDAGSKGYYWGSVLRLSSGDYEDYYASHLVLNATRISKGSASRVSGYTIRPVVSIDAIR